MEIEYPSLEPGQTAHGTTSNRRDPILRSPGSIDFKAKVEVSAPRASGTARLSQPPGKSYESARAAVSVSGKAFTLTTFGMGTTCRMTNGARKDELAHARMHESDEKALRQALVKCTFTEEKLTTPMALTRV